MGISNSKKISNDVKKDIDKVNNVEFIAKNIKKGDIIEINMSYEYQNQGEISKEFEKFCDNNMWGNGVIKEFPNSKGGLTIETENHKGFKDSIDLDINDSIIFQKNIENNKIKKFVTSFNEQIGNFNQIKKNLIEIDPQRALLFSKEIDNILDSIKHTKKTLEITKLGITPQEIEFLEGGGVHLNTEVDKVVSVIENVTLKVFDDVEDFFLNNSEFDSLPVVPGLNITIGTERFVDDLNYKLSYNEEISDEKLKILNSFGFNFTRVNQTSPDIEDNFEYGYVEMTEIFSRAWRIEQDSISFEKDILDNTYIFEDIDNLESYFENNGFLPKKFKIGGNEDNKKEYDIEKDFKEFKNISGQLEGEAIIDSLKK